MRIECPLCGPAEARTWKRDQGFAAVECRSCGLRLTWPPPSAEELARFYAQEDYYETRGMGADAAGPWLERARGILGAVPGVRSVLDVGAGQGHLVAALRSMSMVADGVEPLASGRAAAQHLHGISLLEHVPPAGTAAYDLITLVHALEHVRDPLDLLKRLGGLLGERGSIFIEVPHAGSIEYLRPSRRRELLALPGHLFHFTPGSLARIVERVGLEVVVVRLINPDVLEWLFELRDRLRSPRESPAAASPPGAASSEPVTGMGEGLRGTWRARVLPWLRARWPGYRFELVARPARAVRAQAGPI